MSGASGLWVVVPVKELDQAKQRLAPSLSEAARRALMMAMLEDVLAAITAAPEIVGLLVVTVAAAAQLLTGEGRGGMLTVPGDVPLVTPDEIGRLIAAHLPAPSFTIAPSHD